MRRGASVSQDFADSSTPRGAFTTGRLGRSSLRANYLLLCRRRAPSFTRPSAFSIERLSGPEIRCFGRAAAHEHRLAENNPPVRSEEHPSDLQSLMRTPYDV